ncbi:MAG: hypothetical protein ACLRXQ_02740 [Phascolarctobacterium faecium]
MYVWKYGGSYSGNSAVGGSAGDYRCRCVDCIAGTCWYFKYHEGSKVLTPHPGELGRLLDLEAAEADARRLELQQICC